MAFRVGFHKTLFKLGKWRFGIGYGFHGITGTIVFLFCCLLNAIWYLIIMCIWMMYGIVYVLFILPYRLIKKHKEKKNCENFEEINTLQNNNMK